VNNGQSVSFCLEPWLEDRPICQTYPVLFYLITNQRSVREVREIMAG
jgi:hypothetical protein